MSAFVTGGTGFIGRRLIRKLLERSRERIHVLVRNSAPERLEELKAFWGEDAARVDFVEGDVGRPNLGVAPGTAAKLRCVRRPSSIRATLSHDRSAAAAAQSAGPWAAAPCAAPSRAACAAARATRRALRHSAYRSR